MVVVVPVQFLNKNSVCQAQQIGILPLHFSQNPNAQAWTGKGMAIHHVIGQAEFQAYPAHFILEQFTQRLYQFKTHIIWQSTYIMVRLDVMGIAVFASSGLNDIGIDCALSQPLHPCQFPCFLVEHIDESIADDFAFSFRIRNAF